MNIFSRSFLGLCLLGSLSAYATAAFSSQSPMPQPSEAWKAVAPRLIKSSLPDAGSLEFQTKPVISRSFLLGSKNWDGFSGEVDIRKKSKNKKISPWVPYTCFLSTKGTPPIKKLAQYNVTPPDFSLFYTIESKEFLYNRAYKKASTTGSSALDILFPVGGFSESARRRSNEVIDKHAETKAEFKMAMFPKTTVKGMAPDPKTHIACVAGSLS